MQSSASVFDEVVQYLNGHEETLRLKKLIFCLCKKYWENEPNIVNSVSTEELVQELIDLIPSSDELAFSVDKLVKTINRPKVYTALAKVIINEVGKLYNNIPVTSIYKTDFSSSNLKPVVKQNLSEDQLILENITNYLNSHPEAKRLKKLIFTTAKNQWESNLEIIDSYGLRNLILDLWQSNSTKTQLKDSLYRIAENISKKTLYISLADLLIEQMESLYIEQVEQTQITQVKPILNLSQAQLDKTAIIDFPETQMFTEMNFVKSVNTTIPQNHDYDVFELRLDIIQYTNPLRAKIILYSVLFHPWDKNGQDWLTLSSYTLNDLLEQLLQKNCSLKEIESRLYEAAEISTDPETVQTATIIVQALHRIKPRNHDE